MCILPPVPACTYPSLTVGYLDAWFSSGRLEDADGLLIVFTDGEPLSVIAEFMDLQHLYLGHVAIQP